MRSVLILASLALAAPSASEAHHSVSAMYDTGKKVAVSGRLTRVEIINPHGLLEVRTQDGVVWKVETRGVAGLTQRGFDASTFKIGAEVTVDGAPARDGSKSLWLNRISTRGRIFETRRRL